MEGKKMRVFNRQDASRINELLILLVLRFGNPWPDGDSKTWWEWRESVRIKSAFLEILASAQWPHSKKVLGGEGRSVSVPPTKCTDDNLGLFPELLRGGWLKCWEQISLYTAVRMWQLKQISGRDIQCLSHHVVAYSDITMYLHLVQRFEASFKTEKSCSRHHVVESETSEMDFSNRF